MKNYICKTTTEIEDYMFADIKIPAGVGIYAGEVYVAEELDESIYKNLKNYTPTEIIDITKQDICIVLNGGFEETVDGRRLNGDPDYGHYKFLSGEIATTVRLNDLDLTFEISIDALEEGILPQVGGYLVPTNNSNKLTYVPANTNITAKNFLKIEALKSFRLGGEYGESYTGTVVCRTVSKARPLHKVVFDANPVWATIEVYGEDGLLYVPTAQDVYELPTGKYTYNVSARGYEPVTNLALTVQDEDFEEPVSLVIETDYCIVTFDKTPVDMTLIAYLDGDELIENPDLSYSLVEGDYTYNASAPGYTPLENVAFTIGAVNLGKPRKIDVILTGV